MNPLFKRIIPAVGVTILIVMAFVIGQSTGTGPSPVSEDGASTPETEAEIWTCSMHPQIQLPEPGACPICGMDLIPLTTEPGGDDGPRTISLSAGARAIAEVRTTPVKRQEVHAELRLVGKLEANETETRAVTARVGGRIDRLYVDYTGVVVREGEKLFDIYSPELYGAQAELIAAKHAATELENSSLASTRRSSDRTIAAARERLKLWGLSTAQIQAIEKQTVPADHISITAPMTGTVLHKHSTEGSYVKTGQTIYTLANLSTLWLQLDVYESDLALIRRGQTVRFESEAYPGEEFIGEVAFIDPVLSQKSRSIKVRVNVPNPKDRLKPGMFVRAVLEAGIGGDGDQDPLVIPASAPLITGTRALVYLEDPETEGKFFGKEVILGLRAGDSYVVREGLEEGDMVVTNGAFKIDSALQIRAKQSMMSPTGGAPAPGHHHGGSTENASAATSSKVDAKPPSESAQPKDSISSVPLEFRVQLDGVLELYFELGDALAQDDLGRAKKAAFDFPQKIHTPKHSLLPPKGHKPWGEAQAKLTGSAKDIASAVTLDSARAAFFELSQEMIKTVKLFGSSGTSPVLVYHCPMAMGPDGADWLQAKPGTLNPYYGSKMSKCGAQTEDLTAGSDSDVITSPEKQ